VLSLYALGLALNDRHYHYHPINSKMGNPTGPTAVFLIARQMEAKMINSRENDRQYTPEECVISDFRREVDAICALQGYYAAYSGSHRCFGAR
jgi:hypothetical protein